METTRDKRQGSSRIQLSRTQNSGQNRVARDTFRFCHGQDRPPYDSKAQIKLNTSTLQASPAPCWRAYLVAVIGHSGETWGRPFWRSILLEYWYSGLRSERVPPFRNASHYDLALRSQHATFDRLGVKMCDAFQMRHFVFRGSCDYSLEGVAGSGSADVRSNSYPNPDQDRTLSIEPVPREGRLGRKCTMRM
jgi:hypothetical protein